VGFLESELPDVDPQDDREEPEDDRMEEDEEYGRNVTHDPASSKQKTEIQGNFECVMLETHPKSHCSKWLVSVVDSGPQKCKIPIPDTKYLLSCVTTWTRLKPKLGEAKKQLYFCRHCNDLGDFAKFGLHWKGRSRCLIC
jgi:hypothetical protein